MWLRYTILRFFTFHLGLRTVRTFHIMHSKSRRAYIKQRLFSFEFTFTAHPLLESYLLSPTIMWALILWVAPTGECFLSVLDMISSLPFHGCVINPRFFTFIFGEAVSWERLGRGYLHPSSSPSLPVTSYFLKQRLFTSGFRHNAKKEVIYVHFSKATDSPNSPWRLQNVNLYYI